MGKRIKVGPPFKLTEPAGATGADLEWLVGHPSSMSWRSARLGAHAKRALVARRLNAANYTARSDCRAVLCSGPP